ncbi:MAG: hypothetical protein J6A89_01015 [Clostridia bacterium]|nr:hypothetical protein [Clostridia bacterium]
MELDSVKKIVAAEQKANQIKHEANLEAQRILQETEKSKESSRQFYKRQLDMNLENLKSEQERKTKSKIEEIKAKANETAKKINANSKENMQKAVEEIFTKVVNI